VTKVDFYQGTTLIGTATTAPYSFTWTSIPVGSYSLTVVATNDAGQTTTSSTVVVTVKSGVAQMYFIQTDHLGTPRLIADGIGTTVWRWDQGEPFANDVPNNNPSGAGAFDFPLRFPGQYFDREMNAAYNNLRDYDSTIGRYIESDPIGLRGGRNTYIYVVGDPLKWVDPVGLVKWKGTSFTAGAGAFVWENYDLVSECKCGIEAHARVKAYGLSYERGFSFAGSFVDLQDHAPCPDANLLQGDYLKVSAGLAGVFGGGFSFIILGAASSPGSFGFEFGFDASAGVAIGKSSLELNFTIPCKDCGGK
jgi:RHS repeat-associated protein